MRNKFKKQAFIVGGFILGALAGFMYYKYIGCRGGTCAITSKPFNSSIYGAVMGSLIGSIINDFKTRNKKTSI